MKKPSFHLGDSPQLAGGIFNKGLNHFLGADPKKRFVKFVTLIAVGGVTGYLTVRRGFHLTPESFKNLILSLGIIGPVLYLAVFMVRPFFLIPSIALFIAGGLAFGPFWGPLYASLGAAVGGALGFLFARRMGQEYVMSRIKVGAKAIGNYRFDFSLVFFFSLLPIMPVTVINYGAGLSKLKFKTYVAAHFLGLTPRAFAFGFFGDALLDIGSRKFYAGALVLLLICFISVYHRIRPFQFFSGKRSASSP